MRTSGANTRLSWLFHNSLVFLFFLVMCLMHAAISVHECCKWMGCWRLRDVAQNWKMKLGKTFHVRVLYVRYGLASFEMRRSFFTHLLCGDLNFCISFSLLFLFAGNTTIDTGVINKCNQAMKVHFAHGNYKITIYMLRKVQRGDRSDRFNIEKSSAEISSMGCNLLWDRITL